MRVLENVNFLTLKTECTSINTSIMCDNMRILISSELILDTEFLHYTEHDNIKISYCVEVVCTVYGRAFLTHASWAWDP